VEMSFVELAEAEERIMRVNKEHGIPRRAFTGPIAHTFDSFPPPTLGGASRNSFWSMSVRS
jgi:hypothetical protein